MSQIFTSGKGISYYFASAFSVRSVVNCKIGIKVKNTCQTTENMVNLQNFTESEEKKWLRYVNYAAKVGR